MRLTARRTGADEAEGVHVFGLAEHENGSGWALVFQEGDTDDSRHCVSDHLGRTAYGAITGWSLSGPELRLRLSASAQRDLDLPPDVVIDLRIPEAELGTVTAEMTRLTG